MATFRIATLALSLLRPVLPASAAVLCAGIDGFEAEHRSVLKPADAATAAPGAATSHWTPVVLDANADVGYLFAWRVTAALAPAVDRCGTAATLPAARNVTQLSAVLTLTAADRPALPPIVCHQAAAADRSVVCGGGAAWKTPSTRWTAKLEVVLRVDSSSVQGQASEQSTAVATGWFVRGLPEASPMSWGGAEWIGLPYANDTASQYRGAVDVHALGFDRGSDVARAMLFVAGLGGYRATVNGRAIDPTSIRASVTEWHNRTFYWADDVTSDVTTSADSGHGTVALALEVFKHWYGLSNNFYPVAYGARALKAVLVITHVNGTDAFALPTTSGAQSSWRHGSGSLLFDDLHAGQTVDGRLATPGWETIQPGRDRVEEAGWEAPVVVPGPPGELRAHPMHHSRVLEVLTPANVSSVPRNADNVSSLTYRFTLPYEVAGFCTLLLPRGCHVGVVAQLRHGECVDPHNNLLLPVEAPDIIGSATDTYTCRGNAMGMGAHEKSWRRLAVGGSAAIGSKDEPELEAFTPSFTYSAFKFVEVTYNEDVPAPDASSMRCFRVGTGFDWTGDVAVGAAGETDPDDSSAPTPATPTEALTRCGRVAENHNLTLGCSGGRLIDKILFASFGSTAGSCSAGFRDGTCSSTGKIANCSMDVIAKACVGKTSCVVPATVENFGQPCPHVVKSLAAEVHCSGDPAGRAESCKQSCYDDTLRPPAPPTPPAPPGAAGSTPAQRFNAVVAATRSTAIANYVMDIPTDSPQEEKRGWCGDSLATHRTYAAFFDMRATWIKWTEDQAYTSSNLRPVGTLTPTVPCVFGSQFCTRDPETSAGEVMTGVAWGSILPQLSAFTAALSGDGRYAARLAPAAGRYVTLLQRYANNGSRGLPELLNVTGAIDGYNIYEQGWPSSAYGDWCASNAPGQGGCTSVSALLNSVYFILDIKAALSILHAGNLTGGSSTDSPSEAELTTALTQARSSFRQAFLRQVVVPPLPPSKNSIAGLTFRDPWPPNVTHHGNPNRPPTAQVEAAAGMAAMDEALSQDDTTRAALGHMLAGLVLNVSTTSEALEVGGVIDMAQLGRSLVSYGRPDAAFALLATNGPTSLYHMAASTGTIWAHPGGADGSNGHCGSHNHVMQGGSVGEGLFGIGGIRPGFMREEVPAADDSTQDETRLLLAPVPWLPDAPRGAAVWRTAAGQTSTSWAASDDRESHGSWGVWVNVTVPPAESGTAAEVSVMVPQGAQSDAVCAWECGLGEPKVAAFESQWVSFDSSSSAGHNKLTAVVPPAEAAAAPDTESSTCTALWRAGASSKEAAVAGVGNVVWTPARAGATMYPALTVAVGSGSFAFFARSC